MNCGIEIQKFRGSDLVVSELQCEALRNNGKRELSGEGEDFSEEDED